MKTNITVFVLHEDVHNAGTDVQLFGRQSELHTALRSLMEGRADDIEARGVESDEVEPLALMREAIAAGDLETAWEYFTDHGICHCEDVYWHDAQEVEFDLPD